MESVDLRRQKLNAWRKATGRTPMKRPSYVQEYHKPSPQLKPVKPVETTVIHVHPVIQQRSSSRRLTPKDGRRSLTQKVKDVKQRENIASQVKKTPQQLSFQHSTSSKKLSRREKLDQWLAVHGSTVKKPRSVLCPLNQLRAKTEVKKRPFSSLLPFLRSPCTLKKLKEQFQRELDEDYQETYVEECSTAAECTPTRRLDFNECVDHSVSNTPPSAHKVQQTRRSLAPDPTVVFRSSTVRYSLAQSEPRRRHKRRHTISSQSNKQLVFLTPVRRSTRKNRHITATEVCVDSPTQLLGREGYSNATVEIVPNKALEFDQS